MTAWINDINIAEIAVCAIYFACGPLSTIFWIRSGDLSPAASNPTIWRGERLTIVITYVFSWVLLLDFFPINQYNSSSSKIWKSFLGIGTVFFNPVIHVSLTETKYLSHSASACSCIKCFYCLLANFLRIFPCFRVQGVVFFAFFAKAPLTSRTIFSCIHLVFFFSADWTLPTCFCSCFSHSSILPSSALFVHSQNQENSSGNSLAFSDCRPIQSSFSSCFPSSYAV